MAFVLPVFERFAASSSPLGGTNAVSRPCSPGRGGDSGYGEQEAAAVGGGSVDGGSLADGSLAGGSLASESAAGQNGGNDGAAVLARGLSSSATDSIASGGEPAAALASALRVIDLEVTGDSEAETDSQSARAVLPEPAVPAPDPKVVAIPPDKVRQQLRRPVPRAQRQPLQTLEILPLHPEEAAQPSPRPGSRNATKPRIESKPKIEHSAASAKEKGEEGIGAASGALGDNPYRWVVGLLSL